MKAAERRVEILDKASELFMRFGARSVTMDSIAQHIGVSKKTLYEHFKDKKDLMLNCIQERFQSQKQKCEALYQNQYSPLQILYHLSIHGLRQLEHMNPSLLLDLQKYYRKSWNEFLLFKNDFLGKELIKQIERGKEDGSIREDVNTELVVKLHLIQVENSMDPVLFRPEDYRIREVMGVVVESFLRSISTKKGLKELQKLFKTAQQPTENI